MKKNNQTDKILIEDALIQDIDAIVKLGNTINEFQVSDEVVTFWPKHIIQNIIKSKTDFLIIAKKNKQFIGFIIANYNPTFCKAIIENIFVLPSYRGKGVSNKLRDFLINKLRGIGCEYVCTLVEFSSDNAIKSYEKYGFNHGIECVWLDLIIDKSFSRKN